MKFSSRNDIKIITGIMALTMLLEGCTQVAGHRNEEPTEERS